MNLAPIRASLLAPLLLLSASAYGATPTPSRDDPACTAEDEYSNCVHSTHDVTKHAETGLISAFSPKIDRETFAKSTLYTSTEPCTMCCGAICFAGIGRVVYGTSEAPFEQVMGIPPDKNPLTSHEILGRIAPKTKVLGPLMEAEGLIIHEGYWPIHPEDVGKS